MLRIRICILLLCAVGCSFFAECLEAQVRTPNSAPSPPGERMGDPAPHWSLGSAEALYLSKVDVLQVYAANIFLVRTRAESINLSLTYRTKGLRLIEPDVVDCRFTTMVPARVFARDMKMALTTDGETLTFEPSEYVPGPNIDGKYYEIAAYTIPWSTIKTCAAAKRISIAWGARSYELSSPKRQSIRDFRAFADGKTLIVN